MSGDLSYCLYVERVAETYVLVFPFGWFLNRRLAFVSFYGSDIYLDHIKPGRAKDMLWRIRLRLQTESEFEQAYADAEKLIEDVEEWRKFYATITDEERKFAFTEDASASEPEDSGSSATDSSSDSEPGTIATSDTPNVTKASIL